MPPGAYLVRTERGAVGVAAVGHSLFYRPGHGPGIVCVGIHIGETGGILGCGLITRLPDIVTASARVQPLLPSKVLSIMSFSRAHSTALSISSAEATPPSRAAR